MCWGTRKLVVISAVWEDDIVQAHIRARRREDFHVLKDKAAFLSIMIEGPKILPVNAKLAVVATGPWAKDASESPRWAILPELEIK
jgi:hypothetical protein